MITIKIIIIHFCVTQNGTISSDGGEIKTFFFLSLTTDKHFFGPVSFPSCCALPRQHLYKLVLAVNCALCPDEVKRNNSPHGCKTGKLHWETRRCLSDRNMTRSTAGSKFFFFPFFFFSSSLFYCQLKK